MKAMMAMFVALLFSVHAQAQGSYTICDTTEVCICHDGSEQYLNYVFHGCLPGQVVTLVFCAGGFPENLFTTVFNGPSTASPSMGTLAALSPWVGAQYVSSDPSGALTLRFGYSPASPLSCQNGDYAPLVFWVMSGPPTPPPFPLIECPGAGSSCLPTGMVGRAGAMMPVVGYQDGVLQFFGGAIDGEVELYDLGGRLIERRRVQGAERLPLRSRPSPGLYVAILRDGTSSSSHRLAVP